MIEFLHIDKSKLKVAGITIIMNKGKDKEAALLLTDTITPGQVVLLMDRAYWEEVQARIYAG